jgi:hypothetical protein
MAALLREDALRTRAGRAQLRGRRRGQRHEHGRQQQLLPGFRRDNTEKA